MAQASMYDASRTAALPYRNQVANTRGVSLSIPQTSNTHPDALDELSKQDTPFDSDDSSICNSPGWSGSSSKNRGNAKKGSRNNSREAEQNHGRTKLGKPAKRLTKPPPALRDTIQPRKSTQHVNSSRSKQQIAEDLVIQDLDDETPPSEGKSLKAFGAPTYFGETTHKPVGSFIGSIKLQQSGRFSESTTQTYTAPSIESPSSGPSERHANGVQKDASNRQPREKKAPSHLLNEPGTESGSFASRVPSSAEGPGQTAGHYVSKFEENIPERNSSEDHASRGPGQAEPQQGRRQKRLNSDRPPPSYREPPQLAESKTRRPRRGSFDFLRNLSQARRNESAAATQDEVLTSKASSITSGHSRRRSWSLFRGQEGSSRPTTASSAQSLASNKLSSKENFVDGRVTPTWPLTTGTGPSTERGALRQATLQGIKSAAKAAFSRQPHSVKLSTHRALPDEAIIGGDFQLRTRPDLPPFHLSPRCPRYPLQSPSQVAMLTYEEEHKMFTHDPLNHPLSVVAIDSTEKNSTVTQLDADDPEGDYSDRFGLQTRSQQRSISPSTKSSSEEYHSMPDDVTDASMKAAILRTPPKKHTPTFTRDEPSSEPAVRNKSFRHHGMQSVKSESAMLENSSPDNLPAKIRSNGKKSTSRHPSNASRVSSTNPSFLPTLPHQPLARPAKGKEREKSSTTTVRRSAPPPSQIPDIGSQPTPPSSSSSPTSPILTSARSAQYLQNARQNLPPASTSRLSLASTSKPESKQLAKMFVICCNCRYYHDMPSKIYECMVKPDSVIADPGLGVSGVISRTVKCPWCGHGMSTGCCEGWAAVVELKERLH